MTIRYGQLKSFLHENADIEVTRQLRLFEGKQKWSRKRKEKRRLKGKRQTAISGVQNRPSGVSKSSTPAGAGSNAGQQTPTNISNYTTTDVKKAIDFLEKLAKRFGETMDNVDHSLYIHSQLNENQLVFRLANHRGDARQFTRRGELVGNFGIVIKMNEKRFKPDKNTDYEEEVFYPDLLTDDKMKAIVDGVDHYIQTGIYDGPKGDESNPHRQLHQNPVNQSVPFKSKDAPQDGNEVKESFYKPYKGNKTMKNRINENTKITLTIKQLKKLVKESSDDYDVLDEELYPVYYYDGYQLPEEDKHKAIEALKDVFKTLGIRPGVSAETLVDKALDMHIEIDGFSEKNSELFDGNYIRVDWCQGHVDYLYIPFDGDTGELTDKSLHSDKMSFDYWIADINEADGSVQYIPVNTVCDVSTLYAK